MLDSLPPISIDSLYPVDSIEIVVHDAMDNDVVKTPIDATVFRWMNHLHIETKPSVIRKQLPFAVGDTVSPAILLDAERLLRKEIYLADDTIRWSRLPDGRGLVRVAVQDKWTTNLALNLSRPGNEWVWNFGVMEYNLLGLGYQTGLIWTNNPKLTGWTGLLGIPHFLWPRQKLDFSFGAYSQGQSWITKLEKPFTSLRDPWSWKVFWNASALDRYLYLNESAKDLSYWQVYDPATKGLSGVGPAFPITESRPVVYYPKQGRDTLQWNLYRSFWTANTRHELRAMTEWTMHEATGGQIKSVLYPDRVNDSVQWFSRRGPLELREDLWLGGSWNLHWPNLVTLANFRRVRWTEDVDLGWKVGSGLYKDFQADDGRTPWKWTHILSGGGLVGKDFLWQLSGRSAVKYKDANWEEGEWSAGLETQYRPSRILSWVLTSQFMSLWKAPPGEQLTLGGIEGLTGFPDTYYAGDQGGWSQVETRYFPDFQIGSVAPVFAIFANGGRLWDSQDVMQWSDVHWRTGLGLRLGATKSTQGVVNHLNISYPLNGPWAKSPLSERWQISLIAKLGL
jgi:hypothetical protein